MYRETSISSGCFLFARVILNFSYFGCMKRTIIFLFVAALLFGAHSSQSQELYQKLTELQKSFDFEFETLETNESFGEKYLIRFSQPLDHNGASNDTFSQRVFISHRSFDKPIVFITEGYDANHALRKGFKTELTDYLNANQVCVEHRYFGESKPDSLVWKFLTVENAARDHHKIAELVKAIYSGKIVSTGISKGGQTCNYFEYFFPADADICVPYVAPLNFSTEDKRVYSFLENVGDSSCRTRVLDFQKNMLRQKDEYLPFFIKLANKKGLTYSMGFEKAYELMVFEYSFAFWQWGKTNCDDIPDINAKPKKVIQHLDKVANIDWISEQGIKKFQPFFYQAMHEIGMYGYDISEFEGLTSFARNPIFDFTFPENETVIFEPELMQRVDFFARHKAENMIFIYGQNDPWSATAVEPGYHTNSFKIVKPNGSHRTRINNLPEYQRQQILDSLNKWLAEERIVTNKNDMEKKKKVTGIGGIFFKSSNPKALNEWYGKNLGLATSEYGSLFEFRESDKPDNKAYLQWSPFNEKTDYFKPSEKEFMINYRVENLEDLVEELMENGVTILDKIETYEYGKFVHILDPEGNKIELWEPVDSVFTKLYDGKTTK